MTPRRAAVQATPTAVRAVVYVRVSSDDQAREGTSLGEQEKGCAAYCTARGWEVIGVYREEGVSGAKASRPQLDALMAAVRAGDVDAVVVYKLDRFGRSARHLAPTLGEFDDLGVAFASVSESIDSSTTSGRLLRNLLAVFAEFERDLIRERTASGKHARITEGGWGGGEAPYGYQLDRTGPHPKLILDAREADMIRVAVGLILDDGLTTVSAAAWLNDHGYRPRKAAGWTPVNLRNLLVRGQFDGQWTWAKQRRSTYHAPVTLTVPAILTVDRHQALKAYLAATAVPARPGVCHPLTGRLICACGAPMHGIGRINNRQPRRYRCRYGKSHPGRVRCTEPTVRADLVEDTVWDQVRTVLADPGYLASIAGDHAGLLATHPGDDTDTIAKADGEIHRLQQALATTIVNLSAAGLDADAVVTASQDLQTKLSTAKARRQTLADRHASAASHAQRLQAVRDLAAVATTRLATATPEEHRDLYALLNIQVKIVDNRRGTPLRLALAGTLDHTHALNATDPEHPQKRASW